MSASRRRRIALVTPGFSASESDWCIPALLDLVRALQRHEDLTVFALRYPHSRTPYRVAGAAVVPFGAAQARGFGRLSLWLRAGRRLRGDLRAERFDLVHALWAHEPGALAAWAVRETGVPLVVSVLGGELATFGHLVYGGQLQPVGRRLTSYALARATCVTAGSELLLRCVAEPARARARRLPLGVALERFTPADPAAAAVRLDGQPCLLSVASLVPVKGHELLLRALALARPAWPDVRLHLVGDGPLRGVLLRLAAELGLAAHVRFHGALPHEALPDLYRQADLCVVSSWFESQCLAALEAGACGTPLCGTRVGVLPEMLAPEALTEPGDVGGLATCLTRTARSAAPRAAGLARLVAERFGVDSTASGLRELYGHLLGRQGDS